MIGSEPSDGTPEIPAFDDKNKDFSPDQKVGMPKSMPSRRENVTELAQMVAACSALPNHIRQTIQTLLDPFMGDCANEK